MKFRKLMRESRIEMRDVYDAVNSGSFVGSVIPNQDNVSIWIGTFDDKLIIHHKMRDKNIKRSCISDWKLTFRGNISGWGGDDEDK